MALTSAHLEELRALLGEGGVLATEAARFTYEADALTLERAMPDAVVLPRSTDEVAAIVRWAHAHRILSPRAGRRAPARGGATRRSAASCISVNRMDRSSRSILRDARVGSPVSSISGSRRKSRRTGSTTRPIPASQQVAPSAETSPPTPADRTCLKYGVTMNHHPRIVVVLLDGMVVTLGGEALDSPDFDLASVVHRQRGHVRDRDRDLRAASAKPKR